MNINTSRFGQIEVDEKSVISFPEGIPGFEHTRHYVIVPHRTVQGQSSPFRWLQSIEEPSLALPVINPWSIRPDYAPTVPGLIIKQLGITAIREQAQFLAVVTIPANNPAGITVNLLAPILINRDTNVAKQVIVQNETYSIRTPLITMPIESQMEASHSARALAGAAA
ncbi:MAG: flagellar assembly protein FliW [Capsulimonadaceae bacterium]|nr:flagellar assembly protein FliW [Capsulimonadaceae bacterium]